MISFKARLKLAFNFLGNNTRVLNCTFPQNLSTLLMKENYPRKVNLLDCWLPAWLRVYRFIVERFSFECRKVIGFAITTLRDWFKKLAPHFYPIRNKTKPNRDLLVRVFPLFASATCNYFVFWLVHLIICVLCDWLEWLLWFWFYDTQLKSALSVTFISSLAAFYYYDRQQSLR